MFSEDWIIFECVTGSHCYGTNTPESDLDLRGIVIPPRSVIMSLFNRFKQKEEKNPDRVLYSIDKFMRLAAECNPSIIELFFIDESFYKKSSDTWNELKDNRSLFLSTKAKHTFTGYAAAQLKRIKTHLRWIKGGEIKEPNPETFGISHSMLLGKDEVGSFEYLKEHGTSFSEEIVNLMSRVKSYHAALKEFDNYKRWKAERNPKRAELEEKYGYDCKHCFHLVRLIRQGQELLLTGKMQISNRPDKEELIGIRNGAWSYERLMEYVDEIDVTMDECEKKSILPHSVDKKKIDDLYQSIISFNVLTSQR